MSKPKSNKGCLILFLAIGVLIMWGLPEVLRGGNFFDAIEGSIKAIPYVLGVVAVGYLIIKYLDNQN
ncbi:hypothetical protein [Aquimarina sediminis]|uniref:hypothetical protein n=1 Tax=Aquimarina sediminis TaxID=2070536 RepID=UPI000FFEEE58|nr:hypothetical protein [Aquimarina sediminis]